MFLDCIVDVVVKLFGCDCCCIDVVDVDCVVGWCD